MFELSELKKLRNPIISDSFIKAQSLYPQFKNIYCSVSGGADSDVMIDLLTKIDIDKRIKYVWFDTGLEYQATKDHLKYLENKYNVAIYRYKAIKPIPLACKEYGQPFLSKIVSSRIEVLQRHSFQWESEPFEDLLVKYPKCKHALQWWCNCLGKYDNRYDISRNKWLKEFMVANPPTFKISSKCCEWAKKKVAHNYAKEYDIDLSCVGIRRAEGGIRSISYKSCFDGDKTKPQMYRPLFWYTDDDKIDYENFFGITHSRCYTEYGFERTGCAGCPYSRYLETDLPIIEKYEPKLYKAVNNIFKESYEYTREYREFARKMNEKERNHSYKLI